MIRRKRATKARVFAWIKTQHPEQVRARQIRDMFGISIEAATNALRRLKLCGAVDKVGMTHRARWFIVNWDADVSCKSGIAPACINNLRVNWVRSTGNSHAKTKQSPLWAKRTLLEECWLTTISKVDEVTNAH